ncbi:MAG: hypothetical protein ABJG68_09020 [Crocinitomicaceae bacterium]
MKFNKDIFDSLVPAFKDKGFTYANYSSHNGGLDFFNSNTVGDHRITIDLGTTKKGFVNIYGRISFKEITQTLQEFGELRLGIYEPIVINYDLYQNKENWTRIFKRFGSLPLKTESDIKKFEDEIIEHVEEYIIPFFNKFPDLKSVNDQILSKLTFEEFPNYIPGNCTFKSMIIMKKFNNPRYSEYLSAKEKEYQFYVKQNAAMWQTSYNGFKKLIAFLDK